MTDQSPMTEFEKYLIDIRFQTRVKRSPRVLEVAEAFGIGLDDKEFVVFDNLELQIKKGDVVYITGQSGAGKSVLLRELQRQMSERGKQVVNLDSVDVSSGKPLIDAIGTSTNDAIATMSPPGIQDAYLYLREVHELSDGQRYRFRMAKAIESGAEVIVADEFLAVLDRVSAKSIAYALQKVARQSGVTLLVATTHTDLVPDLCPDLVVNKRFREKILVERLNQALEMIESRPVTREELHQMIKEFI